MGSSVMDAVGGSMVEGDINESLAQQQRSLGSAGLCTDGARSPANMLNK